MHLYTLLEKIVKITRIKDIMENSSLKTFYVQTHVFQGIERNALTL